MPVREFCSAVPARSPRRTFGWLTAVTLLLAILGGSLVTPLQAAEPYQKFLQGLRARQYYDTALQYLQTLEQRSDVSAEFKQVIPFEKAITLMEGAQAVQNPEAQAVQLDQAQAQLEKFLKDSPNHELSAVANTELARIMLGKAQVIIWRSRSPTNAEKKGALQQDARKLVQQARGIFQKAHDAYKKEYESYGVYIPEDETQKRAARAKAEGLYMRAQLDLANSTYEEAQTYDKGSKQFTDLLKKASLEFEDLHSKYRSQYAGLFARTMQGKCFEEQDDIRKALGIYDELLGHPGKSDGLRKLQFQVLHFRLICLNHESRKDYQLIIQEAGDWLRLNRGFARTQTGLGIRWELTRAQEALALDRTTPEADRSRLLRQALENAREVNKYGGPYKDVSHSAVQRILVALDREPGDPKDFDTAFGMANNMLEQIGKLRESIKVEEKAGKKDEVAKLNGDLQAMLSETERIYRLALALANSATDPKQINATRYRLAYMYYLQRKSFETAVVGEYLATRARLSDPKMALDGAYLAMAGYSQAYNDAPVSAKDEILGLMVNICENIATNWPDSDRATDARMEMGRIYRRSDQPEKAAEWYAQVPTTANQYADAQLEAGQAYWNAYLTALISEREDVTPEQLKGWQDNAAKFLLNGITKKQEGVPASNPTPADITRAKVSLAQIEIMRGNEAKAVELMTAEPHSVVKAIEVADGQARPKADSEVKSTTFASFAYQQLLRAYIGTRQLDKAEEARASLERVAGESGGEALTAVYVELGRELQNELERLKKLGEKQRLDDVRNGFETFLSKLFERKEGQTYGSLIWIAETYFGLAEGSEESPQKEKQYYTAAARTYEEIIKRGNSNPKFIDPSRLTGVKLRLVNCKRQEKDYAAGEEIVKEILKANPRALDAQVEAAALYQAWGNAGEDEKLLDAVRGKTFSDGTVIWGWGNIAKRLQMLIESGQANAEYEERNRESRFRLAESRYQFAERSSDNSAADEQLKRAKFELLAFTSISPSLPETPWWKKYDTLYQQIQRSLGEAVVPLAQPEPLVAAAGVVSSYDAGEQQAAAEAQAAAQQADAAPAPPPPSGMLPLILLGVLLLGGLGIGGFMVLGSGKKKTKRSIGEMVSAQPATLGAFAEEQPAQRKRPRPTSDAAEGGFPAALAGLGESEPAARRERPQRPRPQDGTGEQRRPEQRRPEQRTPEQRSAEQRSPEQKPSGQRRPAPQPGEQPTGEAPRKPAARRPDQPRPESGKPGEPGEQRRVRRKPPEQT